MEEEVIEVVEVEDIGWVAGGVEELIMGGGELDAKICEPSCVFGICLVKIFFFSNLREFV